MCMTKKGVMVFLFFFNKKKKKKTALFSFYQHSAAVPYCMIKENSTCNSIYPETFCERYWYTLYSKQNKHLIALECFFVCFFSANHGLTETQLTFIVIV